MQASSSKPSKFFYGWVVVGVTIAVSLIAAGIRSAPGVMLVPMQLDTLWGRDTLSFAASLGIFVFGFGSPVAGWLIGRLGVRLVMLLGLLISGVSLIISSQMTSIWQMNIFWGVMSGLGSGLAGAVIGATVANRWFVAKRGLITGLFGAATSAGQLLFIPALTRLTNQVGWRTSVLIMAVAALVLLVPVLILMRDDPAQIGLQPYGARADTLPTKPVAETGVMGRAIRSSTFWLLAGTFFVCGFSSSGIIGTHFMGYAADCGIPNTTAADLLALMGALNFVGTLASGWLTDRYDPRKLLAIYYSFRGLSLLALPFLNQPLPLTGFMVLFGLDYIATVPPTIALCADGFGKKNVGLVYGWVFCAHQIGGALASWMGGYTRVQLDSYMFAFLAAGALALAAGLLSLRIRRGAVAQPALA